MKTKILFLIIPLSLLLLWTGCEKEPPIVPDPEPPALFTLKVNSPVTEAEFGDSIPVTITTTLCDSVAYKILDDEGREIVIHEYSRPVDLIGSWVIVDTLIIVKTNLYNQAYVDAFHFLPDGGTEVKNDHVNVMGYFPEVIVTTTEASWKSGSNVTITSAHGDYIETDIPGYNGILNGTFTTSSLDSTRTYFVALHSKRNNISWRNVTIIVLDPTREDTLSYKMGPWRMIQLFFQRYPNGPWIEAEIWECDLDNLVYYYLSPEKTQLFDIGEIPCYDGEKNATGYWYLESNGNVLVTYQSVNQTIKSYRDIEILNDSTLTLVEHYDNGQSTKAIYHHP